MKKLPKTPVVVPVDTGAAVFVLSGEINSGTVTPVVLPSTGEVTIVYDAQPTKLAGDYSGN